MYPNPRGLKRIRSNISPRTRSAALLVRRGEWKRETRRIKPRGKARIHLISDLLPFVPWNRVVKSLLNPDASRQIDESARPLSLRNGAAQSRVVYPSRYWTIPFAARLSLRSQPPCLPCNLYRLQRFHDEAQVPFRLLEDSRLPISLEIRPCSKWCFRSRVRLVASTATYLIPENQTATLQHVVIIFHHLTRVREQRRDTEVNNCRRSCSYATRCVVLTDIFAANETLRVHYRLCRASGNTLGNDHRTVEW